ncbi:MAG TPA: subclass B3 metallo-beta-lactamase, partial [Thermomonas sp.]|nr:subclass B3 metallo-beta-lactamase [Thermomonas sp.]
PCVAGMATLLLAACAAPAPRVEAAEPIATATPVVAPCKDEGDWDEATAPRHVFGNTWYVGSCGISAILVTSPDGHILIDGATEAAADGIARSVEASGHRMRDVRVILNTHEHFDHAGGIARLQQLSGAQVLARDAALPVLRSGHSGRNDPQHLELKPFPAIPAALRIADDGVAQVGPLSVQVHATPGHAPGSTSFSWRSCAGTDCRQVVYADSVSALADGDYLWREHPDYGLMFKAGMQALADIAPCDILLTPHPSVSDLWPRLRGERPMGTADACRTLANTGLQNLQNRLQKETSGAAP